MSQPAKKYLPKRDTTLRRYRAIQERYDELYNKKRLRHDDVIQKLKEEFFIAQETTVYRILGTDCDGDPNQLSLEI